MVPGVLAGVALIVPAVWLLRRHKTGALEASMPRLALWAGLKDAIWGLASPVLILGGMRAGWLTPTEATTTAVFYSLHIGLVFSRPMCFRDLFVVLRALGELSAVVLLVVPWSEFWLFSQFSKRL